MAGHAVARLAVRAAFRARRLISGVGARGSNPLGSTRWTGVARFLRLALVFLLSSLDRVVFESRIHSRPVVYPTTAALRWWL